MKIFMDEQGSTGWHQRRHGVVTASEASALVTPTGKICTGDKPETYLNRKVAEKLFGFSQDEINGSGWAADQGNIAEKIALPFYETAYGRKITRVGFCLSDDGRSGCSPDALVGEDGGLEAKHPQPPNAVKYLLGGVVPDIYVVQIQFSLWVTKRAWWEFLSFNMTLPPLLVHVEPEPVFQDAISVAMENFNKRFDAAHAKLAGMMQQGGRQ